MKPVSFNGRVYTTVRELLLAVFRYIPPSEIGWLRLGDILRQVRLTQYVDPTSEYPISIRMPEWHCKKCGVSSASIPESGICAGCGYDPKRNGKISEQTTTGILITTSGPAKPDHDACWVDDDGTVWNVPKRVLKPVAGRGI